MPKVKGLKKTGLRFTHLHLENWKNFSRIDVDLQRRAFLVGPNASGKSNLLDIFRFLRDIAEIGGGFQEAIQRRAGLSSIRCLAARRFTEVAVSATLGTENDPNLWEYELCFNQDKEKDPLVSKGMPLVIAERVIRKGRTLLSRPDSQDRQDPQRLTQTHLEQVNVNRDFRDLVDFFSAIRYLHIVPQLVREPDRSVGRHNDPYGGDFLEQMAHTHMSTRNARLRRIREALQIAVPQLKELSHWRDSRGVSHLRGRYEHWRPRGAWQTEKQFSDGTLRMLGLLWAVLDKKGPLLLEEPELSLHPEVVRYIPQMFARMQRHTGRQILVSTHSAELLQDSGIGLDEVLLLLPHREGTEVKPASVFKEIPDLLAGGLTIADAVLPRTKPERAEQLSLFSGF